MASVFDRYSGRHVPKYGKPFKENQMRRSNGETKTTRPMSLKKASTGDLAPGRLRLRLLVFVENADGSRSSIFDSERSRTPKLSRSAPSAVQQGSKLDNEMRMVFGSFPMKISNNTAIKVHSLKNSNKAMVSNVFTYYDNSRLENCFCDKNDEFKSETASPVSVSLTSNIIPIKKPSLVSSSIQSCSFNANSNSGLQAPSLSSSVPNGMFYGSYAGMYKRLMRSVSNSLISDSTTVQNTSIVESSEELNFEFNSMANFEPKNDPNESERRSLSGYSNNGSVCMHQSLCEKCIENNQYPKYKIGVAILYCLPSVNRKRNASLSASGCASPGLISPDPCSPKNSPQSPTVSSPLAYSNSINIDQSKAKKSFDHQIDMFPSTETPSSSTSSSPNIHTPPNTNLSSLMRDNESFYEFLFSHLPLIEHQFKQLIEKIVTNLPSYFGSIKHSKRISIVKNGQSSARASINQPVGLTNTFSQRISSEFDEYERKFNLLYSSPRLAKPAWLSLIKTKSTPRHQRDIHSSCCLSNHLINDLVHLNNFYKKPTSSPTQFILLNKFDFKKSFLKPEKSHDKERLFFKIFLSTLLKYHLSWVYTVLPSNELTQDTSYLRKQQANWTRLLEKTNPYNPLWAQLSDLHGAVNQPLRLVRCVVVGKNRELVERILFICSYFIRCGNSSYFDIQPEGFDFNNLKSDQATVRINLREMSETKFDPIAHLSTVLNSSAISSSSGSRSASTGSVSASPFGNNLSPVNDQTSTTNAHELPLIGSKLKPNMSRSTRMQDSFGYSLLASYCDEFVFEFVLHGTSDYSFLDTLHQKLVFSKFNSILDCPISESLYIVIDADQFEVKVYSSESSKPVLVDKPIGLVDSLVQSVLNMADLFQNSEFVLLYLEDKLQELYTKSETMNQVKSQSKEISDEKLMQLIDINDANDLDFLKQIQSAITIPNMF